MLRPIVAAIFLLSLAASSFAQEGVIDKSVGWLRSAWATAKKEGRPAAERAIRKFPEQFKAIPKQVAAMQKSVDGKLRQYKLDEKKQLIQELWRIRHCLNLMALLDSGVLEHLTGIDDRTLRAAIKQADRLQAQLQGTVKR